MTAFSSYLASAAYSALNQQDNGKKKSLWDQMHQKKGSAK